MRTYCSPQWYMTATRQPSDCIISCPQTRQPLLFSIFVSSLRNDQTISCQRYIPCRHQQAPDQDEATNHTADDKTKSSNCKTKAFAACKANGTKNVFLTLWGDDGAECSLFSLLPSLYYAAQLAKGMDDLVQIKAGFEAKFGIGFDDFMLLDLPGTPTASPVPPQWPTGPNDPEKYMFYTDCFMGKFDGTVCKGDGAAYAACAQRLAALSPVPTYEYLFRSAKALCDVMAIKMELGIRTRAAYKEARAADLLPDYRALLAKLEIFYTTYRTQWLTDNKPHGFEIQDIRLGGLMQRVKHCIWRLEEYAAGRNTAMGDYELDSMLKKLDPERHAVFEHHHLAGKLLKNQG